MKVELKQLAFGYTTEALVLDDISFATESSRSISIVGASGCGKSTLLRLISGLLPNAINNYMSGTILVDGIDIVKNVPEWKKQRSSGNLGFMFQEPSLFPNLSVAQNVRLPLEIVGHSLGGEAIVAEYLKITGLENEKHKLPAQLSGGMKTRVALARTFISKPTLLLLDEPFASLDIVWKAKLSEEVVRLKNQVNTTVILVTHDIFEAFFFRMKSLFWETITKLWNE